MPIPREIWADTVLLLPRSLKFEAYRDLFTDRRLRIESLDGRLSVAAAELFAGGLPVSLLESVG